MKTKKLTERELDYQRLKANLKLLQTLFSVTELAKLLGVCENTWTNRMTNPWQRFSYSDFVAISDYCNVDLQTLICGTLKVR